MSYGRYANNTGIPYSCELQAVDEVESIVNMRIDHMYRMRTNFYTQYSWQLKALFMEHSNNKEFT